MTQIDKEVLREALNGGRMSMLPTLNILREAARAHLEQLDQTGDRGAALDALTYIRGMVERANGTILEGSAVDSMFKSIERCVAPDHAVDLAEGLQRLIDVCGQYDGCSLDGSDDFDTAIDWARGILARYEKTKKGGA